MRRSIAALLVSVMVLTALPVRVFALNLVRDAEMERILQIYAGPIFRSAGLQGVVRMHVVNDPRINAFVAGGRHMFLHTGLLIEADGPSEVIGVLAHETGHIVGGHLVRMRGAIREAQITALVSMLLAIAAGVAARDTRAAQATLGAGQSLAAGNFFRFTRTQEQAADQYALTVLERLGLSAIGLKKLLSRLTQQEALLVSQQDPYLRTHPLTRARLNHVEQHLRNSRFTNKPVPPQLQKLHARLRAKLIGFIEPPDEVHQRYSKNPNSIEARYAKAVAYHRSSQVDEALRLMNSLLKEQPRDPYFHELKGQILFESSRIPEAVVAYREAVRLAPHEPLIRIAYAHALLQLRDQAGVDIALQNLLVAIRTEKNYPLAWLQLGIAYGRKRNFGMAAWAQCEYYLRIRRPGELSRSVKLAEKYLRRGSPAWVRVQDIKALLAQRRNRR